MSITVAAHNSRRRVRAATHLTAVATVLALVAAGCGFTADPDPGTAAGGATITTYTSTEQNRGLAPLYASYQQTSSVKVAPASAATDELNQQLRVQLTSGTAADIFRVSPGFSSPVAAGVLGKQGSLADLSGSAWATQVDDGTRSLATVDGKLVAFPIGTNAIVMAYNKQVFADLKLSVPTTWTELLAVSAALKKAGKTPIAVGLTGGIYLQFFIYALAGTLVYAAHPDLDAKMKSGATTFSREQSWTEVFDKFVQLSAFFTPDTLGVPPDQAQQSVAKGDAGMTILVAAGLSQLYDYSPQGASAFGLFALPATDDAQQTVLPTAPDFLAVNAASPRAAQAKAFLDYLSQPANSAAYASALGVLPAFSAGSATTSSAAITPASSSVPATSGASPAPSPLADVLPLISAGRTAPFANYLWPNGATQQTLLQVGQELVSGDIDVKGLLTKLDEQYAKGTS